MWFKEFREAWREAKADAESGRPRAKLTVRGNWGRPESSLTSEEMDAVGNLLREAFDKPGDDETPDPKAEGSS